MLFITGSDGFIGRALIKDCERQAVFYQACDLTRGNDICDPLIGDLIPEGSTIIHLAAISTNKACEADPQLAQRVNVEGAINLIRAAVRKKAKQFILASSEWVYEGLEGQLTEDRTLNLPALQTYAESKVFAEKAVRRWFPENHTILRFGIVYGPRKEAGSAVESIYRDVRAGRVVKIGSAQTARRFIHVEDIVSGILASQGHYGTYNLTGDELVSLGKIAFGADLSDVPIIRETHPDNPSIRDAPNDKARITLGWEPCYNIRTGMRTLMEVTA